MELVTTACALRHARFVAGAKNCGTDTTLAEKSAEQRARLICSRNPADHFALCDKTSAEEHRQVIVETLTPHEFHMRHCIGAVWEPDANGNCRDCGAQLLAVGIGEVLKF